MTQTRAGLLANLEPAAPQCGRLTFASTTTLNFLPLFGNIIKINGDLYAIPSGGIAGLANTSVFVNGVAAQNLAASTLYYVYAFINSGVVTADFSTTGHVTSSTTGNVGTEIKSGNDSRSIIGMVYVDGASHFVDTLVNRGVLSWFNRKRRPLFQSSAGGTSTSATPAAMGSTLNALNWAGENVLVNWFGQMNTTGTNGLASLDIDGSPFGAGTFCYGAPICPAAAGGYAEPSEGYHLYALYGSAYSGGGTASFMNGSIVGDVFG